MELSGAVTLFAKEKFVDATDPLKFVVGKLNPFAEVTNSGASSRRRILETPIDQVMPESYVVVTPSGQDLIVAERNVDYWGGNPIRFKYSTLPVDVIGHVGNIGEVLADTPEFPDVYCYPYFSRRETDNEERADFLPGYVLYFPKTRVFNRSLIFTDDNKFYRLRTDTWVDGAGFSSAQAILIEDPKQVHTVDLRKGSYDPVNNVYSPVVKDDVTVFVEDMSDAFEFENISAKKVEVGDRAVSVLKSAADIEVNDVIGPWKVLALKDHGTYKTAHCR